MMAPIQWQKHGMVFRHADHPVPWAETRFAQSPQAISLQDRIRVFYSTRVTEGRSGKFFSHVSYADFDNEMQRVLDVSKQPVISRGELGCFDEHGIFPLSPVRVQNKVFGYTCGWSRRVSVSVETGIGLAISHDDGKTFNRTGNGPILSASLQQPCLVGDAFVKVVNDRFYMWYIFGKPWQRFAADAVPERIYKIAFATSNDGITWTTHTDAPLIADRLGKTECQALPTVIESEGLYHMYFCFRHATDFRDHESRGYRLGYAWSEDLVQWHRDDRSVGIARSVDPGDWDGQMMCYPNVFRHRDRTYLLYNGNHFGREGFGVALGTVLAKSDRIQFSTNHASEAQILDHLRACSKDYHPPLDQRVALLEYTRKLRQHAVTIEAWNQGELVGLVAAYLPSNPPSAREPGSSAPGQAFISNVSVAKRSRNCGVARALMSRLHQHLLLNDVTEIHLRVSEEAVSARRLYERFGYGESGREQDEIRMCCHIQAEREKP